MIQSTTRKHASCRSRWATGISARAVTPKAPAARRYQRTGAPPAAGFACGDCHVAHCHHDRADAAEPCGAPVDDALGGAANDAASVSPTGTPAPAGAGDCHVAHCHHVRTDGDERFGAPGAGAASRTAGDDDAAPDRGATVSTTATMTAAWSPTRTGGTGATAAGAGTARAADAAPSMSAPSGAETAAAIGAAATEGVAVAGAPSAK